MKRTMSDLDSDCDDVFSEESSKGTPTQSNDSCQLLNRKKRRGLIEKRRRDRINNSLSELRRLVPAAFEKQGSAKLEKAEILQMTVDHLKMLHAKGLDAFTFDPHKYAMDYHSIGFRECASEVARYMVAIEGMDLQDPLRLRLMSHLQCYAAQRDLALKSAAAHNPWNASSPFGASPQFPPPPPPVGPSAGVTPATSEVPSTLVSSNPYSCPEPRLGQGVPESPSGVSVGHVPRIPSSATGAPLPSTSMSHSLSAGHSGSSSSMVPTISQMGPSNQYGLGGHAGFSAATSASGYGTTVMSQSTGSTVKHYRPWGAELAY